MRVWDGMEWEDETEDALSVGIHATGELEATQTRQVLYLVNIYIYIYILVQKCQN